MFLNFRHFFDVILLCVLLLREGYFGERVNLTWAWYLWLFLVTFGQKWQLFFKKSHFNPKIVVLLLIQQSAKKHISKKLIKLYNIKIQKLTIFHGKMKSNQFCFYLDQSWMKLKKNQKVLVHNNFLLREKKSGSSLHIFDHVN